MFNRCLEEILKATSQAFDKADSVDFPLKNHVMATFVYALCRQSRDSLVGNEREFLDFVMYASARSCLTYSSSCQDLLLLFLSNGLINGTFVEIGNGIPLLGSNTALLEAMYGWDGVLFEDCDSNVANLKDFRQAEVRPYSTIYLDDQQHGLGPHNASSASRSYTPLLARGGGAYPVKGPNGSVITFLSLLHANALEVLQSLDFQIEDVMYIYVEHNWHRDENILELLSAFGYKVWLPEYTGSGYFFVKADIMLLHSSDLGKPRRFAACWPERSIQRCRKIELLSIHFPKTGGSSLIDGLKAHYRDGYYEDWTHIPGHPLHNTRIPLTVGKPIRAVHGHVRIESYIGLNPEFVFTFIRDPVDLMISFYFYWQRLEPGDDFEHQRFLRERPSIIDFARERSKGYQAYFAGADLGAFDFIGRFDAYSSDLARLGQIVNIAFPVVYHNVSPANDERSEILSNQKLVEELRDAMRDEYTIYDMMRNMCDG